MLKYVKKDAQAVSFFLFGYIGCCHHRHPLENKKDTSL